MTKRGEYMRVMSGFDLPRQANYANPITQVFASDRLAFLETKAGFRHINLHWWLTLEPSKATAFGRKPQKNAVETSRMLAELEKTATILESDLGSSLELRLLGKLTTKNGIVFDRKLTLAISGKWIVPGS